MTAGRFALARPAADIRVVEVLHAVDPGRKLFVCGEIRRNCALFGEAPPEWATEGSCRHRAAGSRSAEPAARTVAAARHVRSTKLGTH